MDVRLGCRVLVPLGTRTVTGTVVALDQPPVSKMKSILELLDDEPSFSIALLELTKRVAGYYLSSWGEVLQAALPTGLSPTSVITITLQQDVTDEDLVEMFKKAPKRAALLRELRSHPGDVTVAFLQKQLKGASVSDQLDALQRTGWISMATTVEARRAPRMIRAAELAPSLLSDESALRAAFDLLDAKAPKQSLALGHIYLTTQTTGQPVPIARLTDELHVSSSVVESLEKRGLVVISSIIRQGDDDGDPSLVMRNENHVELTQEQQHAIETIVDACSKDSLQLIALHGVTGSGKTIIYQRAIAHVLSLGGRALVLVPEISLTPQLADRFRAVFGNKVAVLHSRLATGERIGLWHKIRSGEYSIVIGARSAVFAPLNNVQLIVVDEEHEPSYKQEDPAPRYHGRDVAIMRGQIHGCPVVLGSATPSMETLANVESGRASLVRLTHRADGAVLPSIRVIDLRDERKARRMTGALSFSVLDAITQRIRKKEGTLVFLNRRGYAVNIQCEDCGSVPMCRNCDVALTYHKSSNVLRCHYCGYAEPLLGACVTCGSTDLRESGTGTQRVEEELLAALAKRLGSPAVVVRMDADSTSRRGEHRSILKRFARAEIDVLVGTQMITKGLDIDRVTLVVVVNADMSLHQNDFRASERTVQLLTQLAGRAGRSGARPGEMIIQTSSPLHPAIGASILGERSPEALSQWMDQEMALRKDVMYPPFTRFIVIEITSLEEALAEDHSRLLAALIPAHTQYMVRLDPVVPTIARIRNAFRRMIIIKNIKETDPAGTMCRSLLRNALASYHATYASVAVKITVDIDANGTL